MNRYFIKLKPLSSFYFGSTKSFDENNNNYYLKSNKYPQQTAVLGMFRKKILEDMCVLKSLDKLTAEDYQVYEELIGPQKIDLKELNCGKIKSLSSVQIYEEKNKMYIYSYFQDRNYLGKDKVFTSKGEKKLFTYKAKDFDEKFLDTNIKNKSIFTTDLSIGNNGNKKDDAFFKKDRFRFNENLFYGFYVELSKEILLKPGIIQLGDKHSFFALNFEKVEDNQKNFPYEKIVDKNSLIFLSDFILDNEDMKKINEISQGAFIRNNKFNFIQRDGGSYKTKKNIQNLVMRGSIFVDNESGDIEKLLNQEKYSNYKKIGFNHYEKGVN